MGTTTYRLSRRAAIGAIGAACVLPRSALAGTLATATGWAFGTSWRIVAPGGTDLVDLMPAVEALFAGIDRTFSPWRADSVISRFNAGPAGQSLRNRDLADVTAAALGITRQSGGAFDPTVGPLVARWGFGPIQGDGAPDWRGLSVRRDMIAKTRDDLTVDLCGIAKGWALDRAVVLLRAAGVDNFLFELGGEFRAVGRHPDERNWRVVIETPDWTPEPPMTLDLPSGVAVATSGVWAQSYDLNGRLYSHIIDTGTGLPVSGALRSVTVVAADAMTADGWATALCAAGAKAGPESATVQGLAAVFQIELEGELRRVKTGAIRQVPA